MAESTPETERARANQMFARGKGMTRSQKPHERDEGRRLMKEAKMIHKSLSRGQFGQVVETQEPEG